MNGILQFIQADEDPQHPLAVCWKIGPNMNNTFTTLQLNQIKNRSAQSKNAGMGAIAGYDMRVHTERDPLPALQKIGEGAFNGTVTRSGSAYTKDWTAGAGTMITYADVQ